MISNCGKDERNKYTGGKAGDQTGKEWWIISWYNYSHGGWDCVIRFKNKKLGRLLADLATKSAKNNYIGYDQSQRLTYWEQLKKVNYKPEKIKTNCEADCSSGVCSMLKAIGYLKNIDKLKNITITTTHYMKKMLKDTGLFEILTDKKYLTSDAYLMEGDILLNEQHHTCTNITNGKYAKEEKKTTNKKKKYTGTFPTVPQGSSLKRGTFSKQVGLLQKYLNWYGNYKLNIDNDFGVKTEKAVKSFQKKEKLSIDGHFGANSLARAKEVKK